MAKIMVLIEPSYILQQVQETLGNAGHKLSYQDSNAVKPGLKILITTSKSMEEVPTLIASLLQLNPKLQILAIVKPTEMLSNRPDFADDYFACGHGELDTEALQDRITKMLHRNSFLGKIRRTFSPPTLKYVAQSKERDKAWDQFYQMLNGLTEEQAVNYWNSLALLDSGKELPNLSYTSSPELLMASSQPTEIYIYQLRKIFRKVWLNLIPQLFFQQALPARSYRELCPSRFFWFLVYENVWGDTPTDLTILRGRTIEDLTLGVCVAFNDEYAIYIASRQQSGSKIELSVLISRADVPSANSPQWSAPMTKWGVTIQSTPAQKSSFLIDQQWGLPPKLAWQRFKPIFESMLAQKSQQYDPEFTFLRIHYVPGIGYLTHRPLNQSNGYYDLLRSRGHYNAEKYQRLRGKDLSPYHFQVYQLGVAFIYSVTSIVTPYNESGRHGPWRPWLEPISSVVLKHKAEPLNPRELIELFETAISKPGKTSLADAFDDGEKAVSDIFVAIDWWLAAANCLIQEHKRGHFYGYLEPKAFWFTAEAMGIELPNTRCLDFAAPEIKTTGPTVQSDLYSLALIFAALITKPAHQAYLYQKDWSIMPPSLKDYLLSHLHPDPNRRLQSVAALTKAMLDQSSSFLYAHLRDNAASQKSAAVKPGSHETEKIVH